ncbi:UPF0193 protein EVG1 homolog [Leptidea sinapis]|uniref:UPF0193 protein EVG1 homolog n=1 Tax=Leptidea sinapis TaxID=189913 RepID=UPI002140EC30|nr:UPF0193 protein EVG1 homolog [Leptidea sinapis]
MHIFKNTAQFIGIKYFKIMQTPDANGFVNIKWPSKSVPHGGIFHTKVAEPSQTQQQFLKVLLEESKLSIAQRRKSALALRKYEPKPEGPPKEEPTFRPRTSRRRSLSEIRESGIFESESYRPLKRGEDREKLKDKLARTMQYGDEDPKPITPVIKQKSPPRLPNKKDIWSDLMTQIRERAEWLAEMEDLGHAAGHREIIHDQIAERLRALDALGVDDDMFSTRSSKSGFSVLPSPQTRRSRESDRSKHSAKSKESIKSRKSNQSAEILSKVRPKQHPKEENVSAYNKLALQYSPRRRV